MIFREARFCHLLVSAVASCQLSYAALVMEENHTEYIFHSHLTAVFNHESILQSLAIDPIIPTQLTTGSQGINTDYGGGFTTPANPLAALNTQQLGALLPELLAPMHAPLELVQTTSATADTPVPSSHDELINGAVFNSTETFISHRRRITEPPETTVSIQLLPLPTTIGLIACALIGLSILQRKNA